MNTGRARGRGTAGAWWWCHDACAWNQGPGVSRSRLPHEHCRSQKQQNAGRRKQEVADLPDEPYCKHTTPSCASVSESDSTLFRSPVASRGRLWMSRCFRSTHSRRACKRQRDFSRLVVSEESIMGSRRQPQARRLEVRARASSLCVGDTFPHSCTVFLHVREPEEGARSSI